MSGPLVEGNWDIRAKDVIKETLGCYATEEGRKNEKEFSNKKSTHA